MENDIQLEPKNIYYRDCLGKLSGRIYNFSQVHTVGEAQTMFVFFKTYFK